MENSPRIVIGRTYDQKPFSINLNETPHILVTGSTGSGKSNFLHLIICGALELSNFIDWKLVLIDPKRIEFSVYKDVGLLYNSLIAYSSEDSISLLKKICVDIDQSRINIIDAEHNSKKRMLIVIDEFSDLMCNSPKEVEDAVIKIVKEGAPLGVHIIISTSSPREEVYTKKIIDVFTTKIAGKLNNVKDSLTVLGTAEATKLKGDGDMLFVSTLGAEPVRFQANHLPYENIVTFVTPEVICELPSYESMNPIQKLAYKISKYLP